MASEFITRVEHGKDEPYTVIFTTDDERKYKAIEDACRYAIGHGKPQFQEVVRCKECKHRVVNEHYGEKGYIDLKAYCEFDTEDIFELGRHAADDDWFCADGERRTDEQQT